MLIARTYPIWTYPVWTYPVTILSAVHRTIKDMKQTQHILNSLFLIHGYTHPVILKAQVHLQLPRHLPEPALPLRGNPLNPYGVKKGCMRHIIAKVPHAVCEHRGKSVNFPGNSFETIIPMVYGIKTGDHGQQHLRRANVGRGLFPTDMLLPCLKGHPVGRPALRIFGDPNDTARYFPLIHLFGCKKCRMRPPGSHRHTKSLRGTDCNIGTKLAGRLQHSKRHQVSGHHNKNIILGGGFDHRLIVANKSVCRRILQQDAKERWISKVQLLHGAEHQLNSQRIHTSFQYCFCLRMHIIAHKKPIRRTSFFPFSRIKQHRNRLGSRRSLVQQRSVRYLHAR